MNKLYDIVWWDPLSDPVTTGPFSYGEAHTLMAYKVPHRTMVMVDHPPDAEEPVFSQYAYRFAERYLMSPRSVDHPPDAEEMELTYPRLENVGMDWSIMDEWPDMDEVPEIDYLSHTRRAAGF